MVRVTIAVDDAGTVSRTVEGEVTVPMLVYLLELVKARTLAEDLKPKPTPNQGIQLPNGLPLRNLRG